MKLPIIDVHSHAFLPTYVSAITGGHASVSDGVILDGVNLPKWSVEQHLDTMDQHGIRTCILFCPNHGDVLEQAKGRRMVRKINEELAELITKHPRRFGAYAVVPMDNIDAANEEMAYALDVLNLNGVGAVTHCRGVYLGEAVYNPWFEEMNRRKATLFVHPTKPANFDVASARIKVAILEYMFETTRMITNLVLSGAKTRFRDIKIIATHGGGNIP